MDNVILHSRVKMMHVSRQVIALLIRVSNVLRTFVSAPTARSFFFLQLNAVSTPRF